MLPEGEGFPNLWLNYREKKLLLQFLSKLFHKNTNFFNIGIKTGFLPLSLAKSHPESNVYVIDNNQRSLELFYKNIELNCLENLEVSRIILSDEKLGSNNIYHSIVKMNFDHYLMKNGFLRVDVVRINIDGKILHFLKGSKNTLSKKEAPIIIYYINKMDTRENTYHPVEIIWFLEEYEYTILSMNLTDIVELSKRRDRVYERLFFAIKKNNPLYEKFVREFQ
jgi:tRNA G37 N-methylase Trm5